MLIEVSDDLQAQAVAAGFATAEDYVAVLAERDAERVAIQTGIDDWKAGRHQPFKEFDRQLRNDFDSPSRA